MLWIHLLTPTPCALSSWGWVMGTAKTPASPAPPRALPPGTWPSFTSSKWVLRPPFVWVHLLSAWLLPSQPSVPNSCPSSGRPSSGETAFLRGILPKTIFWALGVIFSFREVSYTIWKCFVSLPLQNISSWQGVSPLSRLVTIIYWNCFLFTISLLDTK